MLEYIKRNWLRLLGWCSKKWKDLNLSINSREKQQDKESTDPHEEECNFGMGEVPSWRFPSTRVPSNKLRTSGEMGSKET